MSSTIFDDDNRDMLPKLLLVDDDEIFSTVLQQALSNRGFNVLVAYDATSAIQLALDNEPEFAVVDLRIAEDSGLLLLEKLISLDVNTRIVMLTGYASIATAVEAIKLGAIQYLTKPTTTDEIVAALYQDQGDATVPPAQNPISIKRLEWEHLHKVLSEHDGNISAAARALNMHRRTLQRKLSKHPVQK